MARKSRKKPNLLPPPSPTAEACYAGAYIRLSVEDEQSAFNQEQLIRQFFIQHDELILSRLYIDDGRSSFIGIRPEFDRMIVDARNKEISCIVVKDFSRFARDYIELGDYLEQLFPMWGTRFISILDDYDSKGVYGHPDFTVALKSIINTSYSRDLSSKVKSTVRLRQQQGTYIPAKVPYGYMKNSNLQIVPNPESAKIVQQIFSLALEGKSAYTIAGILNQNGIPSPNAKFKQSKDLLSRSIWTRNTIMNILRDRTHVGCLVIGKTENLYWHPRKPIKRPVSDWMSIPDHHEAVVSDATFNIVQGILDARKKGQSDKGKLKSLPDDYLGSRLYCGACGRKMKRRVWKGVLYFVCPRSTEAQGACSPKSISASMLKDDIWDRIQMEVEKAQQYQSEKRVYEMSPSYRVKRAYREKQLNQLNSKIETLEKNKFTFGTAMFDGEYNKSDLRLFLNSFQLQKSAIEKEMERISLPLSDYDYNIAADSSWICTLLKYAEMEELAPDTYDEIVDRIDCYDDNVIIILQTVSQ